MLIKNKRVVKIGVVTYAVTIPIAYIRNGQIDPKKRYDVIIKESADDEGVDVPHDF